MGTVINGVPVLLPPPEGYEVDFDNPQRQAVPEAYWIGGVSIILSLLFVAQRLYTKFVLIKKIQADDGTFISFGEHAVLLCACTGYQNPHQLQQFDEILR